MSRKERVIRYKGQKIDIFFTVDRCTHVAECLIGLPRVFNLGRKPWVNADAADPDQTAKVILRCPTGALHWKRKDGGPEEKPPETNTVTVSRNGPLYVHGDIEVISPDGTVVFEDTRLALCRCGHSNHMPLCDGQHFPWDFRDPGKFDTPGEKNGSVTARGKLTITWQENGPLILSGPVVLRDSQGGTGIRGDRFSLCSCGKTGKAPFCDGSHAREDSGSE